MAKWRYEIAPMSKTDILERAGTDMPAEKVLVFRDDVLVASIYGTETVKGLQVASDVLDFRKAVVMDDAFMASEPRMLKVITDIMKKRGMKRMTLVPWIAIPMVGEKFE